MRHGDPKDRQGGRCGYLCGSAGIESRLRQMAAYGEQTHHARTGQGRGGSMLASGKVGGEGLSGGALRLCGYFPL